MEVFETCGVAPFKSSSEISAIIFVPLMLSLPFPMNENLQFIIERATCHFVLLAYLLA